MSSPQPKPPVHAAALRWTAAAGLFGAALVHVMAISPHYEHWRPAGIFFALIAAAEGAFAAMLAVSGRRSVAGAAIALNAATVVLWAVSRTAGVPFGPEAGHAEVTGTADLLATLLETVSMLATWLLLRGHSLVVHPRLAQHVAGVSLTGVLLVGTGVAAAPSLAAHNHEAGAHSHDPSHIHDPSHPHGDSHADAVPTSPTTSPAVEAPAEAVQAGQVTGYVDIHGHRVAGSPADGEALGHPPAGAGTAAECAPRPQPARHAESEVAVTAAEMRFDRTELRFVEGLNVVTFTNRDSAPHNISVFAPASPGCPLFEGGMVFEGGSTRYQITVPAGGAYRFRCDVHPDMVGLVVVDEHHH